MRAFKICLCMLLVFCLCVLPTMQRVHAVVTVTTVVGVLILTVLAAMGITLVVKDMQKEAFVLQKGDSFMQSKGYSGSFAEWVAGGTDVDVALKTGFLVLAKPVVDRIKEFVAWLIPSAASDTLHDLSITGDTLIDTAYLFNGSVVDGQLTIQSVGLFPQEGHTSSDPNVFTDGVNTIRFYMGRNTSWNWEGYYDSVSGEYTSHYGSANSSTAWRQVMILISAPFVIDGVQHLPGIYIAATSNGGQSFNIGYANYFLQASAAEGGTSIDASAVIGSYDDLSQIQEQDGDNTFYITQDGQALNPSSQDLADVIGALQEALDSINQKLDVMPWTAEAAEAGTVKPDYSDFQLGDLDFSTLGALITTRFPFSIPWDLVRIFQLFNAEPVPPHWEVDLLPLDAFQGVDTTIELDLGDYPLVGQVSRWFCIIDLCLGLVFVSKKLIWTA